MSAASSARSTQVPSAVTTAFTSLENAWGTFQKQKRLNTPSFDSLTQSSVVVAFLRLQEAIIKHECSIDIAPLKQRIDNLDPKNPGEMADISFQILSLRNQVFPKSGSFLMFQVELASASHTNVPVELVEHTAKSILEKSDPKAISPEAQRAEAIALRKYVGCTFSPQIDEVTSQVIEQLKLQGKWIAALYVCLYLSDSARKAQKAHIASIPPEVAYGEVLYLIDKGEQLNAYKIAMALPDADKRRALLPLKDRFEATRSRLHVEIVDAVLAGLPIPEIGTTVSADAASSITISFLRSNSTVEEQRAIAVAIRKEMGLLRSPEQDKILCEKIEQLKKKKLWTVVLHLCMTFSASGRKVQKEHIASIPKKVVHFELTCWVKENYRSAKALELALLLPVSDELLCIKLHYPEDALPYEHEYLDTFIAKAVDPSLKRLSLNEPATKATAITTPRNLPLAAQQKQEVVQIWKKYKDDAWRSLAYLEETARLIKEEKWEAALELCLIPPCLSLRWVETKKFIASIPLKNVYAEIVKHAQGSNMGFTLAMLLPDEAKIAALKHLMKAYNQGLLNKSEGHEIDEIDAIIQGLEASTPRPAAEKPDVKQEKVEKKKE